MQRLVVISLAGIGDTLMSTPFIHELRLAFPDAQLDALVMWPGAGQLLETQSASERRASAFIHQSVEAVVAALCFALTTEKI